MSMSTWNYLDECRRVLFKDQNALNISPQNLKICFRYVGIITIIILALYALAIVFAIVGATAFS